MSAEQRAEKGAAFIGSVRLLEAMEQCAREHIMITETDPPAPVKPYIWCLCGWRSDQAGSGPETAGNGAILHLANEMHRASVPVIDTLMSEREVRP